MGTTSIAPPSLHSDLTRPAAATGLVTILPSGTVTPVSAPISQAGNTYTLTSAFAGSILDERNGSTLNGAGFTLTTTPGNSWAVVVQGASGVTIKGLTVTNDTTYGFADLSSGSLAIVSDTVTGTGYAVYAYSFTGLNLSNDQFSSTEGVDVTYGGALLIASDALAHTTRGIYVEYVGGVTIQNDNLSLGTGNEIDVEYSTNVLVTHNTMYNTVAYTNDQVYLYQDSHSTVTWNNGSSGDYLVYGEYLTATWIANNHFPGIRYSGVYIEYSTGITVDGNFFPYCSSYGFYGYYVSDFTFTNNMADHAGQYGVYLEYGANGIIAHNNLSFFYYEGIYLEYSGNVSILSNQISYTVYTGGEGIYTYEDSLLVITSNNVTNDQYGWYDDESAGVVSTGNDFSHTLTNGYAIYLYYDGAISITNTQGSYSHYGLYADYTNGLTVTNANFNHAGSEALYVYEATAVVLTNIGANFSGAYALDAEYSSNVAATNIWATISGNYAFYLYEDVALTLSGCDAARSTYGIYSGYVSGLTVSGNNLSQDQYGLYIYSTSGAVFSGNSFWVDNFSFDFGTANAGVLYHNNFINDKGWVVTSLATASFAWANGYPEGGNYWSNYTGIDVKSGPGQNLSGTDRIGDTPYIINPVTADPYPLMGAWASHTITFTESGLAAGKSWSVSVDGAVASTNSNALVFVQADGATASFSYAVPTVSGYHVSPSSGIGTESGANLVIGLVFTPVNYTVTFTVAGLPGTAGWSLTINGHTTIATGPTLTIAEPNGTYAYSIVKGSSYSITPSPGTFSVSSGPVTVALTATEIVYNLTFTESGLGSGTSWSVTLNGVTKSSTTSTIIFQEPNGTYTYTVGSIGGFSVTPSKGTASVTGGAIAFAAVYASSGLTGTSLLLLFGLILVLLVAIAGWVMYMRARKPKSPTPASGGVPPWSEGGSPNPPPPPPAAPPAP